MRRLVPAHDRLIVAQAADSLYTVADTACGVIAAIGDDSWNVKVGDTVVYNRHVGLTTYLDGAAYRILSVDDILATIEDDE